MQEKINHLITSYLNGTLNEQGLSELKAFLISADPQHITAAIRESMYSFRSTVDVDPALLDNIAERVLLADKIIEPINRPVLHRVHFLRTAWFRYAAAVIVVAGAALYLWLTPERSPLRGNDKRVVENNHTENPANKVILTLASGKKIELENTKTPLLVKEGVVFDPREAGQKPGVTSYNMITTPKGIQYQLILPDGTKAWLNAASSIRFPSTFTGKSRHVITTGEVFFEVAVNKMAPFFVSSRGMEVQVLGTSFNVNAYEDESSVKTSLVEGAVKITPPQGGSGLVLAPGQAYVDGKVIITNIDQDIAWKNGLFNFNGLTLKQAMNQLARWYDVEVVYKGELPPFDFYGEMGRDLSLTQVLKGLSGLGVEFKVEGKKLIVSQ